MELQFQGHEYEIFQIHQSSPPPSQSPRSQADPQNKWWSPTFPPSLLYSPKTAEHVSVNISVSVGDVLIEPHVCSRYLIFW